MSLKTKENIPLIVLAIISLPVRLNAEDPKTERQYLSGTGPKDAVPWSFRCTGGRRAGEDTTIPVPSHWELKGFGTYNYGQESAKSDEHGLYQTRFTVPDAWAGRRIRLVFNGVMNQASVKVNGRSAGPDHEGGFYQFRYDITGLLDSGKDARNLLEVDVAKAPADHETDRAERDGDYWTFGGIFRPVWIEAVPERWIEHVAIDARADGNLTADLTLGNTRENKRPEGPSLVPERIEAQVLDDQGKAVGEIFTQPIPAGGVGRLRIATSIAAPQLWTAEKPLLHTLRISRMRRNEVLHTITQRFGFRTFEVRDGVGLFLNGQRILLKGVDRHSFRPETGRALDPEDCYEDVRLMKSMNMNAARMSHYPPDEAFLEACDELGLYVLDELSGWQRAHGTEIGRKLVREMVERDVNHPSILFWDNGNEGGFNRDLDGEFALYDPQQRRVLHPWDPFSGVDTEHYPDFNNLTNRLKGPNLVMPTEFMHGLYDGGAGAGLDESWRAISESPFGAGGFIWVLADEGIVRTDQNGRVDVFSTFAPDGIVGPHHEKEGSYHTVRDVWSPVQIVPPVIDGKFDGRLVVANKYDFTSLGECRFAWKLLKYPSPSDAQTVPKTTAEGVLASPEIPPHGSGGLRIPLPENWSESDALSVIASGPDGQELWNWVWPLPALSKSPASGVRPSAVAKLERVQETFELSAGGIVATVDVSSGLLRGVRRGEKQFALSNGPKLVFAKPASQAPVQWLAFEKQDAAANLYQLAAPHQANRIEVELEQNKAAAYSGFKLEISSDGNQWKTIFGGSRRAWDGTDYDFPPQTVKAVRLSDVHGSDGRPGVVKAVRLGDAAGRFPSDPAPTQVSSGSGSDPVTGESVAWVEARGGGGLDRVRWTMHGDGSLQLDYQYVLNGEFLYHGITFDHPEERMKSLRWLGQGPYRVWKNRTRGTWLGVHQVVNNNLQAGESWGYPEFQGYFAGLRWATLETDAGSWSVASGDADHFLRIGTAQINHPNTSGEFPAGDLSFLHAIPAIGSKFTAPEKMGPSGEPARAEGNYSGRLIFHFGESAKQ